VVYAGHGDLVEDQNGNWYVVMLATRRCKNHGSMGRETFLAKVVWQDGWPVIAAGTGRLEKTLEVPLKEYRFPEETGTCDTLCFWETRPDQRLLGIGGRNEASYSLTEKRGVFRLYCGKQTIGEDAAVISDSGRKAIISMQRSDSALNHSRRMRRREWYYTRTMRII